MGFLFEHETLFKVANDVRSLPPAEMVPRLIEELTGCYPGHIAQKQEWIFNLAAGATGIMNVLHGSLSEYLIVFGSPIGTEGYSGRYALEIHDYVLKGEMATYTEADPLTAIHTRPGEHAVLRMGRVKGYSIVPGTWMLEHGRGLIPSSLPCGLSDALIGALDFVTTIKTFRIYGGQVIRELLKGKI